jgi:hypothetical protein
MAKTELKNKVLDLRKEGMSYSQIKKICKVSKSTLSRWLENYPLSKARIRELRDWNEQRIERYRETRRQSREKRLAAVYKEQRQKIFPLSKRDLFIAGLFLYWGEGSKTRMNSLIMTDTDPGANNFFIDLLKEVFDVPKAKLKVRVQLYADMDIEKELKFWSKQLKISRKQFMKTQMKRGKIQKLTRKGGFGHGTCSVILHNTFLAERVICGLQIMRDEFGS